MSQYTSDQSVRTTHNNALRGGDQRLLRGVYVGHHERSGAAIFLTPDGVKRGTRIARMMEHERWDRVFSAMCVGVPWQLRACTQLASGVHNAKVAHDDRCRDRIGELMAGDDDQRQAERVSGSVHAEVEIPCAEDGEEVDVGEPTADLPQSVPQSVSQPVPTVRVGGSSGSRTRSGVGSRASEINTDDREVKRVRIAESRGQKRQGEDF